MITVEEAKAHCRIEHSEEDTLFQSLIKAACRHAENHTGRAIEKRDSETAVIDGFPHGRAGVELPWSPLQSVTEVRYLDTNGTEQTLTAGQLAVDHRTVYPTLYPAWGTDWPATNGQPMSITITANVGYDPIPEDIRSAMLLIIGHLYENREAVVIGTMATTLPFSVETLLAPYVIHPVG